MQNRKRFPLILLLLLLIPALSAVRISEEEFEQRVFARTNLIRSQYGLPQLEYDQELSYVARLHCFNMGEQRFFDHRDPQGMDVKDRVRSEYPELIMAGVGENLYMSERSDRVFDPEHVVAEWMKSPGHRKNILDEEFTHLGVGIAKAGNRLYTTQVFATPLLRLVSPLPGKLLNGNSYKFDFEYLSSRPKDNFACSLSTPDSLAKVMIDVFSYYEGMAPVRVIWRDEKLLTLIMYFNQGSGNYALQAGWGDFFYSDLLTFKVR